MLRVGGHLVGAAFSVVPAALLLRHLGVRDAGRYVTVTTLVGLFGGLIEAGLSSIAVRELSATVDPRASSAESLGDCADEGRDSWHRPGR